MPTPLSPRTFQTRLLHWYDQQGRKDLPWQHNKTPYRVWISEIMLQQTQVNTVIDYFQRFIARFPDVETLAKAKEDDVLHLWTGLGYYQRARNLQKAAKMIVADHHGQLPDTLHDLENLPGIGRSTAGAILSIAWQKASPILDGNVKRVLTRLHGITEWPGEKTVLDTLWRLAERYTPKKRVADYTQAIMDLGATLCVRSKPRCFDCPFSIHCIAHAEGIEKNIPHAKPKKTLPIRQATFLIVQHTKQVLLQKRNSPGVWNGLWSLPELSGFSSLTDIKTHCQQQLKYKIQHMAFGDAFRHTFSHYHLDIQPVFIHIKPPLKKINNPKEMWYNLQQSQTIGLPAPVKSLLNQLGNA